MHNNLGNAYLLKEEIRPAEQEFKAAIRIKPDFIVPYIQLAVIYIDREKSVKKAEEMLFKALAIDPNSADAYYHLGRLYFSLKDETKGHMAFQKAIELNPAYMELIVKR